MHIEYLAKAARRYSDDMMTLGLDMLIAFRQLQIELATRKRDKRAFLSPDAVIFLKEAYEELYGFLMEVEKIFRTEVAEGYYDRIECDEFHGFDMERINGAWKEVAVLKGVVYSYGETDTNRRFFTLEQMSNPNWMSQAVADAEVAKQAKIKAEQETAEKREAIKLDNERQQYELLKAKFESQGQQGGQS